MVVKNFFLLQNADHDWDDKYYLEGPPERTEEEFHALCCSLIEQAGYDAIEKAKHPRIMNDGLPCPWTDLVSQLLPPKGG